jgi:peptidoglycan hydrolase-like protein with peptidoglycan-binding domain
MESNNTPKKELAVEETVEAVEATEPTKESRETAEPTKESRETTAPPAAANAVIGNAATDSVYLSKCVFKNMYAKKSLTVHHVQRRLNELGYHDAYTDKDGWYGDLTKHAVSELQADLGIEGDGTMDAETFAAIFDGDHNVTVVID